MSKRDRNKVAHIVVAGTVLLASLALYICIRESLANAMCKVLASR